MNFWTSLFRGKQPPPAPPVEKRVDGYAAYTTIFDQEIRSSQLDYVLVPPTPAVSLERDQAWQVFDKGLQAWRMNAEIHALNAASNVRASVSADALKNTVVTLLIDHSGSMGGQNILLAAASTHIAEEFLSRLGCCVEILGFTTSSWKGGRARELWLRNGRPGSPGRLCELLHIVYRSADENAPRDRLTNLRSMLRPDLLKENVDGEALQWAVSRLAKLPHKRKALVVISDGAPVDDSTLSVNPANYLERHLLHVISMLGKDPSIALSAIGIGYDVSRYYRNGRTVHTPDDLGTGLLDVLTRVLIPGNEVQELAP